MNLCIFMKILLMTLHALESCVPANLRASTNAAPALIARSAVAVRVVSILSWIRSICLLRISFWTFIQDITEFSFSGFARTRAGFILFTHSSVGCMLSNSIKNLKNTIWMANEKWLFCYLPCNNSESDVVRFYLLDQFDWIGYLKPRCYFMIISS